MALITAKKVKYCTGFRGCKEPIFTGEKYFPLRRGKTLCKSCIDKINEEPEDDKFWRLLLNKFR